MKKLDVLGEVALMYMPASDELRDYLRLFRLEPASEVKFLELADRELKNAYLQRYALSPEGEIFLLRQKDTSEAVGYFTEWPLSVEAQKQMLTDARQELVLAYVERDYFGADAEGLLFVPELAEAARLYVRLYPLFEASEVKMMAMEDAAMVADYLEHDDLHEAAELMLLSGTFCHLAPAYAKKWGFGEKAAGEFAQKNGK